MQSTLDSALALIFSTRLLSTSSEVLPLASPTVSSPSQDLPVSFLHYPTQGWPLYTDQREIYCD